MMQYVSFDKNVAIDCNTGLLNVRFVGIAPNIHELKDPEIAADFCGDTGLIKDKNLNCDSFLSGNFKKNV